MAISMRVDPVDRDVKLIFDELLSPEARSAQFAESAQLMLDDADNINRTVLGRVPPSNTFVDGREGAALSYVKVPGVIVREYELVVDVLLFIADELRRASPVGSGSDKRPGHPGFYRASHTLFADGTEVPQGGEIPAASEYVFLSDAPYARKVEKRSTIYEMTAAKASRKFGNVAKVRFTWRGAIGGVVYQKTGRIRVGPKPGRESRKPAVQNAPNNRFPAIVVTIGS